MTTTREFDADFPLRGITLLIADDEFRLRQIVVMMAEELGARVLAVDSGEAAVETYSKQHSEIDLILLDLRMNGMGGEAAFHRIREFDPNARIVLSSGIRPDEELVATIQREGGDFIEKPFDMDMLGKTLSRVARQPTTSL